MAIKIASKKVSEAALSLTGIASYICAGIQNIINGFFAGKNHTIHNSFANYKFPKVKLF